MTRVALALFGLSLIALPASAQEAGRWGALAFGSPDRTVGHAVDYATRTEAIEAALAACGGRCTRTVAFYRICGAVAESPSGAVGVSVNRWRDRAVVRARTQCGRDDCTPVTWACTSH